MSHSVPPSPTDIPGALDTSCASSMQTNASSMAEGDDPQRHLFRTDTTECESQLGTIDDVGPFRSFDVWKTCNL